MGHRTKANPEEWELIGHDDLVERRQCCLVQRSHGPVRVDAEGAVSVLALVRQSGGGVPRGRCLHLPVNKVWLIGCIGDPTPAAARDAA